MYICNVSRKTLGCKGIFVSAKQDSSEESVSNAKKAIS
jgi:hypothetical protein